MSTISDEKKTQLSSERKIRFRPTKVLFSDTKVDEIFKNEKPDTPPEQVEQPKKGEYFAKHLGSTS